jgi:hypothetical protein
LKVTFTAPPAEADPLVVKTVGADVSRLQQSLRNHPEQKFHDMSFVFSDAD